MLNYIWGGLIVFSLVFALVSDIRDAATDRYRNGEPLPVTLAFPDGYQAEARRQPVEVRLDPAAVSAFYDGADRPAAAYEGTLVQTADGNQLRFAQDVAIPEPLATIRSTTSARDNDLRGPIAFDAAPGDSAVVTAVTFPAVRWVKMNAITQAAFDFAETAVSLALGLIGGIALWMGLLQIAEASGLLYSLIKVTQPVIRLLFPNVPKGHPALGMIVLNLSANMLGLGNAATPLGIKAMQELQELNPTEDTATNPMVMLLAMNTASVQIVPPVLLVAIMGLQVNQLFFSILITTMLSLIVAVTTARLLGRLKRYRSTDPNRVPADDDDTPA